jgi:hypothetical protein
MRTSTITVVAIACLILVAGGLGCAALSNLVTPAVIDPQAVRYVDQAGVGDANEYGGYGNLDKAIRLQKGVDSAHGTIQLDLQQQAERDNLTYSALRDVVSANLSAAVQREEQLFGPQGLLSLGLSMAGFGTLTGLVGLMRKRPGDVTSAELQQAVTTATGATTEALSDKQRQFVQLVQGIGEFMGDLETPTIKILKTTLDRTQDTDTQVAVAAVKKELNL